MDEIEKHRQQALELAKEDFPEGVEERFGPGTIGAHEALDRAFMVQSMWEDFVSNHPTIVLNKELFGLAFEISEKLAEFYCRVGSETFEKSGGTTDE